MCDSRDLTLYAVVRTKRNCRTRLNLNLWLARNPPRMVPSAEIIHEKPTYRYRSSRYCATVSIAMVRSGCLRQRLLFD
jgi:hypothetical protein